MQLPSLKRPWIADFGGTYLAGIKLFWYISILYFFILKQHPRCRSSDCSQVTSVPYHPSPTKPTAVRLPLLPTTQPQQNLHLAMLLQQQFINPPPQGDRSGSAHNASNSDQDLRFCTMRLSFKLKAQNQISNHPANHSIIWYCFIVNLFILTL